MFFCRHIPVLASAKGTIRGNKSPLDSFPLWRTPCLKPCSRLYDHGHHDPIPSRFETDRDFFWSTSLVRFMSLALFCHGLALAVFIPLRQPVHKRPHLPAISFRSFCSTFNTRTSTLLRRSQAQQEALLEPQSLFHLPDQVPARLPPLCARVHQYRVRAPQRQG